MKKRKLILTNKKIINCSDKNLLKKVGSDLVINGTTYEYSLLSGITTSLIKDQSNFILHFSDRAEVEMFSEKRTDVIDTI